MSLLTLLRRKGVGTGTAAFAPTDIAGLKLWLKAGAIVGLNDGDPVGTWTDSSGQGNDAAQPTAAKKPIYKVSIANGQPVVRFDGTDDWMNTPAFTCAQPCTLYVVATNTVNGGYYTDAGITLNSRVIIRDTAIAGRVFAGTGVTITLANMTAFHVLGGVFNGASSIGIFDGAETAGNAGAANGTGLTLGASELGAGGWLNGDIAEVIYYDSALSAANRQNVENYLGNKYGITVT